MENKYKIYKRALHPADWRDPDDFIDRLINRWVLVFNDGSGQRVDESFERCVKFMNFLIMMDLKRHQLETETNVS